MQAVKFFLISLVFIGCANKKHSNISQESFEVVLGKSKDGSTIIAGECLDRESKKQKIPAAININGVVLPPAENGYFKHYVWDGSYKVKAGFIGKKWEESKIKLEKGDSVFIRFYLRDDDTPLYQK